MLPAMSEITHRISRLDDFLGSAGRIDVSELAGAFVEVMSDVSFRGTPCDSTEVISADEVDRKVADSEFISALNIAAPWLVSGPLSNECVQHWIGSAKAHRPGSISSLEPKMDILREPLNSTVGHEDRSLRRVGLYTSSATGAIPAMWRLFMDANAYTGLWSKPWLTWRVTPHHEAKILVVKSARDWVSLLEDNCVSEGSLLRPDWASIAEQFDGIHFTPAAVCAAEGFRLETRWGLSQPVYWDVECTLWLRWVFDSTELIGTDY